MDTTLMVTGTATLAMATILLLGRTDLPPITHPLPHTSGGGSSVGGLRLSMVA